MPVAAAPLGGKNAKDALSKKDKEVKDVPLSRITPHPNFAAVQNLVHPLKELPHEHSGHHDEHHHDDHGHHDPSPRDTQKEEVVINAYNALIKQLRNDIHMQNQVYQALEKMDRPYLKGVKGDQQSAKPLVSYANPPDLGFPVKDMEWENNYLEKMMDNKDRWIGNTPFHQKYDKMSNEI